MIPVVKIQYMKHQEGLERPSYKSDKASGMDLRAAIEEDNIVMEPGDRYLVPTGIKIQLPEGYEAQIRPRSGMAFKQGLTVVNAPGTIDNDYRGEIFVAMINLSGERQQIARGDRVAQIVICPFTQCTLMDTEELSETERGSGGFGSTGVR